jgi:hypothetical protein
MILFLKGIFKDKLCAGEMPNHAILIVGYNMSDPKKPYWIAKNSYGTGAFFSPFKPISTSYKLNIKRYLICFIILFVVVSI